MRSLSRSNSRQSALIAFPILATVNGMVGNRTTRVDLSTLDALSKVLGCEPGDLLEREPKRKTK